MFLINGILGLNPSAMDRGNLHPWGSFCRFAAGFLADYRLGYRIHLHYLCCFSHLHCFYHLHCFCQRLLKHLLLHLHLDERASANHPSFANRYDPGAKRYRCCWCENHSVESANHSNHASRCSDTADCRYFHRVLWKRHPMENRTGTIEHVRTHSSSPG
jgi:hypothetical protein